MLLSFTVISSPCFFSPSHLTNVVCPLTVFVLGWIATSHFRIRCKDCLFFFTSYVLILRLFCCFPFFQSTESRLWMCSAAALCRFDRLNPQHIIIYSRRRLIKYDGFFECSIVVHKEKVVTFFFCRDHVAITSGESPAFISSVLEHPQSENSRQKWEQSRALDHTHFEVSTVAAEAARLR